MSYVLNPYAVDLDALRATVGSGDQALVHRIEQAHRDRIARHDDWFADEIRGGHPSLATALTELVDGRYTTSAGYAYGYALELLCADLGRPLSNDLFSGIRWSWLERVDETLASLGAPAAFRAERLASAYPVSGVPLPDDFPSIGHLTPAAIDAACAWLPSAALPSDQVGAAIREMGRWLESAGPGEAIVGFYA